MAFRTIGLRGIVRRIYTARTGQRIELASDPVNELTFHSGAGNEDAPGRLQVDDTGTEPNNRAEVQLEPPTLDNEGPGHEHPRLWLRSGYTDSFTLTRENSVAALVGDNCTLGTDTATVAGAQARKLAPMFGLGGSFDPKPLTDPYTNWVADEGNHPLWMQAGYDTVNFNASGFGVVTFPEPFPNNSLFLFVCTVRASGDTFVTWRNGGTSDGTQAAVSQRTGGAADATNREVAWIAIGA